MKKFLGEFKDFINRGNVMDLAVAVIIGGAFTAIVTALTNNIINPLISVVAGGGAGEIPAHRAAGGPESAGSRCLSSAAGAAVAVERLSEPGLRGADCAGFEPQPRYRY